MNKLKPLPVLHVAGENDELVKFAWQQQAMSRLRSLNECGEGTNWDKNCTQYSSPRGTPVVTLIHAGTHKFPEEAPALIVKFFQEHRQPEATKPAPAH